MSLSDELLKLAQLLDAGLLTKEEFEAQKQKLLSGEFTQEPVVAEPVNVSQAPNPAPAPRGEEETFFETDIAIIGDPSGSGNWSGAGLIDGSIDELLDDEMALEMGIEPLIQTAKVRITNRRAILGGKTYSLQNIAAVEITNNDREISQRNFESEQAIAAHNSEVKTRKAVGMVLGLASIGVGGYIVADDSDATAALGCCIGVGLALMGWGFSGNELVHVDQRPWYTIRLSAAGTNQDVIMTYDKDKAEKIRDALNEAIVNLSM